MLITRECENVCIKFIHFGLFLAKPVSVHHTRALLPLLQCRGDGHTLNCYEEGYFVQPEQCPLNITDPDCLLCNTTSKSSSPPKDSVSMMEDSEELEETEEMLMVCNRMEVSEVPSDDDDDDVADSCLCATSSENCTNCNRCNVSVAAVVSH